MLRGSRVIFLSSTTLAVTAVTPAYLLYNASKGAIEQMGRVLAKDLGKQGITVNVVSPGPTRTELFFKDKTEQQVQLFANANPFGKLGEPDEIADVVGFLASHDARWVNGQNIRVNGGMA
jgi:3-oxoacyl-[acyl-carrier protein] reductase